MAGGGWWRALIRLECDKIRKNVRNIHGFTLNSVNRNTKVAQNELKNGVPKNFLRISHNLDCHSRRWKYGKNKNKGRDEDEDDEDGDDSNADFEFLDGAKNAKIINPNAPSMRIDVIVKSGLGVSRVKAEMALYESRIRINGEKVLKKGHIVNIEDVIDLIIGPSPKNPKFTIVNRITILDAKSSVDHIKLKILREKNLTVDEYANSYKRSSDE